MDVSVKENQENTTLEVVSRRRDRVSVNFTGTKVFLDVTLEDCEEIALFFEDLAYTMWRAA